MTLLLKTRPKVDPPEVSMATTSIDPLVAVLPVGTEVGALARALDDGGLFLRVWGRRGVARDPTRRLALEAFGGTAPCDSKLR